MLQPWNPGAYRDNDFESDYKYEYSPIPQLRKDLVWNAIRDVIREINSHDLVFANAGVRIYDTTPAPPIWPPSKDDPEHSVKFYTFTQEGLEFPMTVPVPVMPRFGTLNGDMLYVKPSQKWLPLKEWLLTIPHKDVGRNRTRLQMLRVFWKRNGKVFRLFELPVEMRQVVYEHALGRDVHPRVKVVNRRNDNVVLEAEYTRNMSNDGVPEDRAPIHPPNLALLQVCEHIHNDAMKTEWESALKCFNHPNPFYDIVAKVGPLRKFNGLAKVQLNFTLRAWFHFFGILVDVDGDLPISLHESVSRGVLLTKDRLPKLDYLEMRFRDPQDGYADNPSSNSNCCQVDMVDMICTFAFPFVSQISNVKIEGFVKTASKKKWERIYDHERRGLSHDHGQQASMQAILHAPSNLL
jgi:hypothetical protein